MLVFTPGWQPVTAETPAVVGRGWLDLLQTRTAPRVVRREGRLSVLAQMGLQLVVVRKWWG